MPDFVSFKSKEITGRVPLKRGDVILQSKPFAYVVAQDMRGRYCEFCLSSEKYRSLFPCKKCYFHFYCSEACQQQSWDEFHKKECANLKRYLGNQYNSVIPNFARLLARIIFKLQDGGEKFEEKYCLNRGRKYKDLMNHYKDIKNDAERMKDVHGLMEILKGYMGEENVPNESDFIGIYGRALVNRFCLNDELNVPMGSAVFLAASIFDHSCIPNAHPSFIGKKLYVRTLVDVPELNLDKVRISYVDCINGTDMRRKDLFKHWYFWCDCELCNSEDRKHYENFMICENPMCGEEIPVPDRYSQVEFAEDAKKRKDEDSATALKNALKASKVEYNFANVPLNPFASSDAMMAYLFYDKDRYKPASDSDLTECTDENPSPSHTPSRQMSPEPSNTKLTNGDAGHLANGVNGVGEEYHASEETPMTNGVTNGEVDETSADGAVKQKKKSLKSKSSKEDKTPSVNGVKNTDSEAKKKALVKKSSTIPSTENEDEQSTEVAAATSGVEHLSNGVNGVHENEACHTNGYFAEDEIEKLEAELSGVAKKKKKLVRRQVYEKSNVLCKGCNCYVDRNTLREYRSAVSFTIQRLQNMKEDNPNFQIVLDVMERQGNLLPKLNVWRVRTMDFAFNAAFHSGAWVLAMKYGAENYDGMTFLYGKDHPTLGLFYMKLGKVHLALKIHRKGLGYVLKAKEILSIAMGPKHPFITGELEDLERMAEEDLEIAMEKRLARMREKVCPCCGNKKINCIKDKKATEKPWERDRRFKDEQRVDSEYFNTNDYTQYY